jgi:hypothetical protein
MGHSPSRYCSSWDGASGLIALERTRVQRCQGIDSRTVRKFFLFVATVLLLASTAVPDLDADNVYPNCIITAIDASNGIITSSETTTGKTFYFLVTDPAQLEHLRIHQGIWIDNGQASFDGAKPCACTLVIPPTDATSGPNCKEPVNAESARPASRLSPETSTNTAGVSTAPGNSSQTRVASRTGPVTTSLPGSPAPTEQAAPPAAPPPKPVAFPDSVGSKGGLWIGTAHGEKTVTYTRPTLVVHHYKNTIRVRLREVVGGVIFNSDPTHFHRIGSEIALKNEGTQYEGDYQGTLCSDHAVRLYRDITLGHFWYKTLDEPIKKGNDIPPEGLYELVFLGVDAPGIWRCQGRLPQLTYDLGGNPIEIGYLWGPHSVPPDRAKLAADDWDPEGYRKMSANHSRMVGDYTFENQFQDGSEHVKVNWNICRAGSAGCSMAPLPPPCGSNTDLPEDSSGSSPQSGCKLTAQMLRQAFDRAFNNRNLNTPPCYVDVQSKAPAFMTYQIPLGRNYNLLPTAGWVNSQFESGALKTPQEPGNYMLVGAVQHVDNQFRVMMRIDSLETGVILVTSKGDGSGCDGGLDTAVDNALKNLNATLRSYAPRP